MGGAGEVPTRMCAGSSTVAFQVWAECGRSEPSRGEVVGEDLSSVRRGDLVLAQMWAERSQVLAQMRVRTSPVPASPLSEVRPESEPPDPEIPESGLRRVSVRKSASLQSPR